MNEKNWYASKTLWVNALALIGIIVQGVTGNEIIVDAETQAGGLALINFILRLVTNKGVRVSGTFVMAFLSLPFLRLLGLGVVAVLFLPLAGCSFFQNNPELRSAVTLATCREVSCRSSESEKALIASDLRQCADVVASDCVPPGE